MELNYKNIVNALALVGLMSLTTACQITPEMAQRRAQFGQAFQAINQMNQQNVRFNQDNIRFQERNRPVRVQYVNQPAQRVCDLQCQHIRHEIRKQLFAR